MRRNLPLLYEPTNCQPLASSWPSSLLSLSQCTRRPCSQPMVVLETDLGGNLASIQLSVYCATSSDKAIWCDKGVSITWISPQGVMMTKGIAYVRTSHSCTTATNRPKTKRPTLLSSNLKFI